MSYDISRLSEKAKKDMAEIYNSDPDTVNGLCDWQGEIGRLANICLACGKHYSH